MAYTAAAVVDGETVAMWSCGAGCVSAMFSVADVIAAMHGGVVDSLPIVDDKDTNVTEVDVNGTRTDVSFSDTDNDLDDASPPPPVYKLSCVLSGVSFLITASTGNMSTTVATGATVMDSSPPIVTGASGTATFCDAAKSSAGLCVDTPAVAADADVAMVHLNTDPRYVTDPESGVVSVQQRLVSVSAAGVVRATDSVGGVFGTYELAGLALAHGTTIMVQVAACNPWGMCSDFVTTGAWWGDGKR